jgi:DNA repair protein RadA/Sms
MIAAVLGRRVGLKLGNQDIIVNATGGIKITEPAADLAIALAIASSFRDEGVDMEMVAVGEIGLSGELRAVSQITKRLEEVARLGFRSCLVPAVGAKASYIPKGIKVIPVSTLKEAVRMGLVREKKNV